MRQMRQFFRRWCARDFGLVRQVSIHQPAHLFAPLNE